MAETTKIAWADATVNWWIGCTEVSAACDFCYARELAARYGWAEWGPGKPRHKTKSAPALMRRLERQAVARGVRLRAFMNSLSDFFDKEINPDWRDEAFDEIEAAPHVDALILTKRPNVARDVMRARYGYNPPANIWLGTTAEDQPMADLRIPIVLDTPAAVRFVSYEPALGAVDFTTAPAHARSGWLHPLSGDHALQPVHADHRGAKLDWIIVGGESGPRARPFDLAWARAVRDQCEASGTAFFMKQAGANAGTLLRAGDGTWERYPTRDRAGADPSEWPEDLRVQEFPR